MRKIKEILRLKHENGLSVRKIGTCCNLNRSTVSDYLARAKIAGISWPIPDGMDDETLENLLFPKNVSTRRAIRELDFPYILQELRKTGVTLQLLSRLAKTDLLILDEWGMAPFNDVQGRELLELVDDRHQLHSTIIVGQIPVEHWYQLLPDPTVADAILDRLWSGQLFRLIVYP
ncbi:MAG: ATP-binding protein [Bacillota bacterium]